MFHQVREDGSHFEQSSAYHVYSADFFLFHARLERVSEEYLARLRRMADYLTALSSADGRIPLLGDDDGGRLFHPFGPRRRFGAGTLAACCVFFGRNDWPHETADLDEVAAWWFGETAYDARPGTPEPAAGARLFADAGVAVLGAAKIIVDTRGFGWAGAGHSHAHALEVVCGDVLGDVLIDPGTYTYVGEPEWRARFRGTGFHNTVRIDGLDQATGSGPFRWLNKPETEILRWSESREWCLLDAVCAYRGMRHRRTMVWLPEAEVLAVVDQVSGVGEHRIEQFWHCGGEVAQAAEGNYGIGGEALLVVPGDAGAVVSEGGEYGWQSEIPGLKTPRPVIVVERRGELPVTMGALLVLRPKGAVALTVEARGDGVRVDAGSDRWIEIPHTGDPAVRWVK
jgi:hypothetical protein